LGPRVVLWQGEVVLWNVSILPQYCTASQPRRPRSVY